METKTLQESLPRIVEWIDSYIKQHKTKMQRVADSGFPRLNKYFTEKTLKSSYVATVDKIVTPPLSKFGLKDFASFESGDYGGITYKNTFFTRSDFKAPESLYFHEMVHVIQWNTLGPNNFLLTYAHGLKRSGYKESPLEKMAYDLQEKFECKKELPDLENYISTQSLKIMQSAQSEQQPD